MAATAGSLLSRTNFSLDSGRRQIDLSRYVGRPAAKYLKKPLLSSKQTGFNGDWKPQTGLRNDGSGLFLAGSHPMIEKGLEFKFGIMEKQFSRSKVENRIKKSQVGLLLGSIGRGRSISTDRISQPDTPGLKGSSGVLKVRPSSSHGALHRNTSPNFNLWSERPKEKSSVLFPKHTQREANTRGNWFCSNLSSHSRTSRNLLSDKRINMTDIHTALNLTSALDRPFRNKNRLEITKKSCKELLADPTLFPHHKSRALATKQGIQSSSLLYHKISSQKMTSAFAAKESATCQLLDENKRLFEKKKKAFKENNLD